MSEPEEKRDPKCVFCLAQMPLETYLECDHACVPCGELHLALLDGEIPRVKD